MQHLAIIEMFVLISLNSNCNQAVNQEIVMG